MNLVRLINNKKQQKVRIKMSQITTSDMAKEELLPFCSCGRAKAVFFCKQKVFCNSGQGMYCAACMEDHDHGPMFTMKKTNEEHEKWLILK